MNNLANFKEGTTIECIKDVLARHTDVPLNVLLFEKDKKYEIVWLATKKVLAVADIAEDKVYTYYILPDQGFPECTWDYFNAHFKFA